MMLKMGTGSLRLFLILNARKDLDVVNGNGESFHGFRICTVY